MRVGRTGSKMTSNILFLSDSCQWYLTSSWLWYNPAVPKKRAKADEPGIFVGIRKPTAPPSRKMRDEKLSEKADPARRKSKHKKKITEHEDL